MNLQTIITILAGGPGSGCNGPNCGRHKGLSKHIRDELLVHGTDTRGKANSILKKGFEVSSNDATLGSGVYLSIGKKKRNTAMLYPYVLETNTMEHS